MIKQLPMVRKLKEKLRQNLNIRLVDMDIKLTNRSLSGTIKDILENNVCNKYFLEESKANKILSLANLDHKTRKDVVKNKKQIPIVANDINPDQYICTSHLGQNGGLVSEISRTITVTDTPHITVVDEN